MNFIYILLFFMFIGPIINYLSLYIPGLGFWLYMGLMFYYFYASNKRRQQYRNSQYQTYQNYTNTSTNNAYQNSANTSSKVKSDVIDVEFSERPAE